VLTTARCDPTDDRHAGTVGFRRGGRVKSRHVAVAGVILTLLAGCGGGGGDAGSASQFCDAARAAKTSADTEKELFNLGGAPPPELVKPAIEDFAAKFSAMNASAPSLIKADVDTINKAAQQLLEAVKTNGFDVAALINKPEFTALSATFSSAEYETAQGHFQDYIAANCGISPTDTTITPGT
jgi:hypothetical protein